MWERIIKNKVGQVDQVYSTVSQPHFYRDNKPGDTLPDVKYTVEYIRADQEEALEKSLKRGSSIEPWELRDEYHTDSLGLAIREILMRMLDDSINAWLFMEVAGREVCAEIPGDLRSIASTLLNKEREKTVDNQREQIDALTKELEVYQAFVEKYNAGNLFKKFKEENNYDY